MTGGIEPMTHAQARDLVQRILRGEPPMGHAKCLLRYLAEREAVEDALAKRAEAAERETEKRNATLERATARDVKVIREER